MFILLLTLDITNYWM